MRKNVRDLEEPPKAQMEKASSAATESAKEGEDMKKKFQDLEAPLKEHMEKARSAASKATGGEAMSKKVQDLEAQLKEQTEKTDNEYQEAFEDYMHDPTNEEKNDALDSVE